MVPTVIGRNVMLDAFAAAYDFIAAHDDWPSRTGANNELSGGSYARQAHTFNSASAAALDNSNQPSIPVPAGGEVQWLSGWTDVSGGSCGWIMPAGGAVKKYVVDVANNEIESVAHGFSDGDRVVFFMDTPPGGLNEGTVYFVVNAATDTFQVEATVGGGAIDLTNAGSAHCKMSRMVPESFSGAGTYQVTDADLGVDVDV